MWITVCRWWIGPIVYKITSVISFVHVLNPKIKFQLKIVVLFFCFNYEKQSKLHKPVIHIERFLILYKMKVGSGR